MRRLPTVHGCEEEMSTFTHVHDLPASAWRAGRPEVVLKPSTAAAVEKNVCCETEHIIRARPHHRQGEKVAQEWCCSAKSTKGQLHSDTRELC